MPTIVIEKGVDVKIRHPKLAAAVKKHALTKGHFTLASGAESNYYLDGKLVSCHPEGAFFIADAILDEVEAFEESEGIKIDAIGGMDMGATPIIGAVALRSGQRGMPIFTFIVRKESKSHGTKKTIEGHIPDPPGKVVIVDDVVTKGGSIMKAIEAVQEHGCEVVLALSVVDRDSGGRQLLEQNDIEYQPLVTIKELGVSNESGIPGGVAS